MAGHTGPRLTCWHFGPGMAFDTMLFTMGTDQSDPGLFFVIKGDLLWLQAPSPLTRCVADGAFGAKLFLVKLMWVVVALVAVLIEPGKGARAGLGCPCVAVLAAGLAMQAGKRKTGALMVKIFLPTQLTPVDNVVIFALVLCMAVGTGASKRGVQSMSLGDRLF